VWFFFVGGSWRKAPPSCIEDRSLGEKLVGQWEYQKPEI